MWSNTAARVDGGGNNTNAPPSHYHQGYKQQPPRTPQQQHDPPPPPQEYHGDYPNEDDNGALSSTMNLVTSGVSALTPTTASG